ncbi:MAG TPA: tRNA wybutosine-synthesizing 3 family protein [Candidatus Nanoarchaeia archaeon]|nr:tRNA wybutosine-synthesizing 3 family protein [Candidatus Nanoarchaeia archaeon]
MSQNNFNQRKKAVLDKEDKSSIGNWDKKIINLCNKINSFQNYYTTSSCSGRAVIMIDQDKKSKGLFIEVSHKEISFEWLKETLEKIKNNKEFSDKTIKFKTESPILHVVCKNLEKASKLLEKAKHIGFKRSGINTFGKNIMLELNSTEKIEFPIIQQNEILVNDDFLKIIVKQVNNKLEKGWEKIKRLEKSL